MAQKTKRNVPPVDPHASYKAKAQYYERYSTNELMKHSHLEEVGVFQHAPQTEMLSLRVDNMLLAQLKKVAEKKQMRLQTPIRTWLVEHAEEEKAA